MSTFDNRLLLAEGVAERLVRSNDPLRPLLQRDWAAMDDLPESRLQGILFGSHRVALDPV